METFDAMLACWAAAEAASDVTALGELLDGEFRGDGPAGAVLDRAAWLAAHRSGSLRHAALRWRTVETRVERRSAVAVGIRSQVARFDEHDWSGAFLCTVVAVHRDARWRLVNLQLSDRLNGDRPPRGLDLDHLADVLRAALYERGGHGNHP